MIIACAIKRMLGNVVHMELGFVTCMSSGIPTCSKYLRAHKNLINCQMNMRCTL